METVTKAEMYKALEKYGDTDGIKVRYVRDMLIGKYDKPPIGVKPWWIAIPERIAALSSAIERTSADPCKAKVEEWTMEINLLTLLMQKMRRGS